MLFQCWWSHSTPRGCQVSTLIRQHAAACGAVLKMRYCCAPVLGQPAPAAAARVDMYLALLVASPLLKAYVLMVWFVWAEKAWPTWASRSRPDRAAVIQNCWASNARGVRATQGARSLCPAAGSILACGWRRWWSAPAPRPSPLRCHAPRERERIKAPSAVVPDVWFAQRVDRRQRPLLPLLRWPAAAEAQGRCCRAWSSQSWQECR
jgi:hypothetical protein